MNTPIIIVTQSYIDTNVLTQSVAYRFFGSGVDTLSNHQNSSSAIRDLAKSNATLNLFPEFDKYQTQRRIILCNFDSKKDMRDVLAGLFQVYSEPTLLFLGNINDYSIALQEGMLKLLEEPPHNLQIVMYAHSVASLLPTITSRSHVLILQNSLVMQLIDPQLKAIIDKKLPSPSQFVKTLVSGRLGSEEFASIDFAKVERDHIDFWLWQVSVNLTYLYAQKSTPSLAHALKNTHIARHLNTNNVQKKFVLYQFLT